MVEGERREHGAIPVDLGLDQQGGAADAVERHEFALIAGVALVGQHGHQGAVGRHVLVAFEDDVVLGHFGGEGLGGAAVLPGVVVVGPDVRLAGVVVRVALHAVGDDDGFVVRGQVLDQGGRGFDDVGVEPENPGGGGAEGREQEGIAGAGHGCPPSLLVVHFVAFGFILGWDRGVKVLTEDGDAREAVLFGARLRLGDGGLESGGGGAALARLWNDEAQGNEMMWIG